MSVKSVILPNTYRDSVFLMKLSSQAKADSGADQVSAMMGTPRNKELFAQSGLSTPEVEAAGPDDLVIAIKGEGDAVHNAETLVRRLLTEAAAAATGPVGETVPRNLAEARETEPGLNLAIISVAGDYARYEAAKAVNAGMDVMLYSDNISLQDEIALKRQARRKGVLVMGPDCGTAIIDGVPLGFANAVARGPVGIVGASGTGLQEVICLLDRLGVGLSQAYGTGGRDLKDEVGGLTALDALSRLQADKDTEVVVLLGKPPGPATRAALCEALRNLGKPVFVHYLGAEDYTKEEAAGLVTCPDLTALALAVAESVNPAADVSVVTAEPAAPTQRRTGFLRGLFGGGTLCQEAAELAAPLLHGEVFANLKARGCLPIAATEPSRGHCFWDFGDDAFTVGRPHPMMAPELKMERLIEELLDPDVAVILIDMVIGHGAHRDQTGELLRAVDEARRRDAAVVGNTLIVASVCGTDADSPSRSDQVSVLHNAGIVVCGSNAQAARLAARSVSGDPR